VYIKYFSGAGEVYLDTAMAFFGAEEILYKLNMGLINYGLLRRQRLP